MWSVLNTKGLLSDPHRESLLPEKQRSVYCVVTFSTHRTSPERESRGRKQTSFVSAKTSRRLLVGSGLWCHCHGSACLWPLGRRFLKWLHQEAHINYGTGFVSLSHAHTPPAPAQTCMHSSKITKIDQWVYCSLSLVFFVSTGKLCYADSLLARAAQYNTMICAKLSEWRHYLRQKREGLRHVKLIILQESTLTFHR